MLAAQSSCVLLTGTKSGWPLKTISSVGPCAVKEVEERLTQRLGFSYFSDTPGSGPFIPVYQGEIQAIRAINGIENQGAVFGAPAHRADFIHAPA